ncbi:hypothetical protein GCM10022393_41100 [Aquimarina addita]|uniref:DUF4372 domain-containing protein n=1 Tax=Aquimarina addita TaxID=870485 RepID=A0ABP6UUJ7_9FLAO
MSLRNVLKGITAIIEFVILTIGISLSNYFWQLTSRNSLRDISICLKAHKNKLYQSGLAGHVNQSSSSCANERRDWRIFADLGQYPIDLVRPMYINYQIPNINLNNQVFALDFTTISLSLTLFICFSMKYPKGAVKVHTLLDLRGNIHVFIYVSDGKYHDSNALDLFNL